MDKNQEFKAENTTVLPQCEEGKQVSRFEEHTQWLIKMITVPLTEQSVIVGFYYFWRGKKLIFKQFYKGFQPEDRKVMKQRAWICQQYCKRYLGETLELWYRYFIASMNFAVPNEPLVELQQEELRSILQRIYQTHDPNFKEPYSSQKKQSDKKVKAAPKGLFRFFAKFIFKSQKQQKQQEREQDFQCYHLMSQNDPHHD